MIRQRDLVMCIILTFITCGIYGIYWFICLADDVNTISNTQDTPGVMVFLLTLITCGIYGFYWAYRVGEKLDSVKAYRGIPATNGGVLYLILFLLSRIVTIAVIQYELNKLA